MTLISSPHDTASTVLLSRGAVRVGRMIQSEYVSFLPHTPLEEAKHVAAQSGQFIFPVLDEDGKLVGILSKSDFIKPIPRQLILVDHNELTQAVRGAEDVPIIEILDHHKLGGFASHTPIHFWNNPVGSTSSIVALCYQNAGVQIPQGIAGLLMSGLLSDTLNLTSPTTTATDRRLLAQLSGIAGVDPDQLSNEIFAVGSPLLTMTPGGRGRFQSVQGKRLQLQRRPDRGTLFRALPREARIPPGRTRKPENRRRPHFLIPPCDRHQRADIASSRARRA